MLIGLCGPKLSGKSAVATFLVNELSFTCIDSISLLKTSSQLFKTHESDNSLPSTGVPAQCWRTNVNVVIDHIDPSDPSLPDLLKRPYFLLIYVDAPLLVRFFRSMHERKDHLDRFDNGEFYEFVRADDQARYGFHFAKFADGTEEQACTSNLSASLRDSIESLDKQPSSWTLHDLDHRARLHISNKFLGLDELFRAVRALNVTDRVHLRPSWDAYFMSLARLAADRTNCMKRRVGCVIARDFRMVASGYNGTPSGVTNCFDGGCARCNGTAIQASALDLCLCLHAEENAIIEAGRDCCRDSTLYTSLFPCLLCAKKIVQSRIARVVYEKHYATDDASEQLLRAGGVTVNRFERKDICNIPQTQLYDV